MHRLTPAPGLRSDLMTDELPFEESRPPAFRAVVWTDDARVPLLRRVCQKLRARVVTAGSPDRGRSVHVAAELGAQPVDDLRAELSSTDADVVLIASAGAFGRDDGQDARSLLTARARGVRVLALEPIPSSALDLAGGGWSKGQHGVYPADALRVVPMPRRAPAFATVAAEVLPEFGRIDAMFVTLMAGPHQLSLGLLLFAAMDLLHGWAGEPEQIDASWVGPESTAERRLNAPPDRLDELRGHVTANVRFADGRSASVVCSDRAGRWQRAVTLLGAGGRLEVDDQRTTWIGPDGAEVDSSERPPPDTDHCVDAIVRAVERATSPLAQEEGRSDHVGVLTSAHTALLSARTGHPESPQPIRRALRGV